ncbi:Toll-like receptor Tollo [Chionoecetes opilio]|uniref:Toll-like receptor Tollo n=1 Tax=Chionoecetes opilio TaxID=41210 RepID=A0A8J4YJH3_CHIOP|nr:Toll-like receptor Tollo [Chionoecetes opilio]
MKAVVAIQVLWSVVAACGAIVYTPPQHCDWTERDGALGEVSLSCHLGALLSDLDSGNFSSSQADPVTELRVVCSDPLLTQPSLPSQAFRRLHNLDTLTIEYCNLKELQPGTFQGLEGMRRMTVRSYISEGPFMTLKPNSLEGMPRLQRLDLGHSYIKSLPGQVLCPVPALRHLNLTGNLLQDASEVDVSGNCGTNLVTLDMSRNDLVVIPRAGLAGLESLEALYLQHNKLSRWLTQGALLGLSSLNLLNLSSNGLDRLSPDLFRETLNLTELYIQNNSLSRLWPHDLLSRLSHLTTLDLSNNLLTSEGVTSGIFHGLLQLTMLNLSHNRLTQVSVDMFRDLAALQVLNLSHNNLTVVTDKTLSLLTNLHRLDLSHNALHVVSCRSFAGLHALSSLALAYNNIYWVASDAFENCTGLRDLSLEHNLLQDVPKAVHEATALRTLRLNHNKLTNISQDDLSPLDALRHLDLSGNLLTSVCKACLTALLPWRCSTCRETSWNRYLKVPLTETRSYRNCELTATK